MDCTAPANAGQAALHLSILYALQVPGGFGDYLGFNAEAGEALFRCVGACQNLQRKVSNGIAEVSVQSPETNHLQLKLSFNQSLLVSGQEGQAQLDTDMRVFPGGETAHFHGPVTCRALSGIQNLLNSHR